MNKPDYTIPLCIPNIKPEGQEAHNLKQCIDENMVSTAGSFVGAFEKAVTTASDGGGGVATSAGTTGLHVAYVAAGVKHGDLVICPALTFIATANAISHAGATPWLFDVNENSWTINVEQIAQALERDTLRNAKGELIHSPTGRRVAAMTPVFTLGLPADMEAVMTLSNQYNLPVIADGAAALGSTYQGKKSGDLGADFTMYSFNGNKIVTSGGGGVVVSQDQEKLEHLRHLTTTARIGADYHHDQVGFNYRMTNLEAAVGCAQMEQLEEFVSAKNQIAERYNDAFSHGNKTRPFPILADRRGSNWFSGFQFVGSDGADRSEKLRKVLLEANIGARPFWKPMHWLPPYENAPREEMDVTDNLWQTIVTLPCSTQLTESEQSWVIDTTVNWLENN